MGHLSVSHVSKTYRTYPSAFARMLDWISPTEAGRHVSHTVLHDISFSLTPGESIGLVGANGAGKSTLLKIIAGTLAATQGSVSRHGSVVALLELGMGFHPDFSGRENVYTAAQLLGLTNDEIRELLPAIESFAEIGQAIDAPVRTYSSGMQMRLAFSVATARRPDILIIDEALSVGDAYFQHKSFDRIRQFRTLGTTLIIVSHDRTAIQSICDRAILLHRGTMRMDGPPEAVMDLYNGLMAEEADAVTVRQNVLASGDIQTISGTGEVCIEAIELKSDASGSTAAFFVGDPVTLTVKAVTKVSVPKVILGFMIKDRFGQAIYGINTYRTGNTLTDVEAGELLTFTFRFNLNIGIGNYSIAFSLSGADSHLEKNFEWRDYGAVFQVSNRDREPFVGSCWLDAKSSIERSHPTC